MRFVAFINLFLYCLLNLHSAFDGHVQVLCVEKDGHVAIETYDVNQLIESQNNLANTHQSGFCCSQKPEHCQDCTDYYLGTGHADTQGFKMINDLNVDENNTLTTALFTFTKESLISPLEEVPTPTYLSPLLPPARLVHIPTTVLLI